MKPQTTGKAPKYGFMFFRRKETYGWATSENTLIACGTKNYTTRPKDANATKTVATISPADKQKHMEPEEVATRLRRVYVCTYGVVARYTLHGADAVAPLQASLTRHQTEVR